MFAAVMAFCHALKNDGRFEILHDEDVTEKILPTFYVLDEIKNSHVAPFAASVRADIFQNSRFYGGLFNLIFGKSYRKLQRPSRRYETFAQEHEYRLILLKKLS